MGSFIEKFLNFRQKPRDGAVGGHPLTENSQLILLWANRTTQSTGVRVIAKVYMPWNDTTETRVAIGPVSSSGTSFSTETPQISALGTFSNGEQLVGVGVTSDSISNPMQLWASVLLREKTNNAISIPLCQGYIHATNVVGWVAGSPTGIEAGASANGGTQGALFTFQGTVVNGAGGAGDQSMTVAAATGGRVEILFLRVLNGDTTNRSMTGQLLDGVGGNIISDPWIAANVNAGVAVNFPTQSPAASTGMLASGFGQGSVAVVCGGDVLVFTLAAVAASENSAWSFLARVWGGAPTITLAGASTPTLTTNTSRFETG